MKAICLFSGGLDSSLAAKVIQGEGVTVTGLYFFMPFLKNDLSSAKTMLEEKSKSLGIPVVVKDISLEFLDIVKNPRYGYGKNYNPCIDCKILMLRKAKEFMGETGASFVATGEVLGQRPKSQHKDTLRLIEKQSGLEGLLLRPLSAKLMPPTIAEQNGWINRERLPGFYGRSRKPQINLAKELGITDYAWPGGGCLLTYSSFCTRIEDLLKYNIFNLDEVVLLKIGRHFRLSPGYKLVVGRNEGENKCLQKLVKENDIYFEPQDLPGPSGLGRGLCGQNLKELSAGLISRYIKHGGKAVKIRIKTADEECIISACALEDNQIKKFFI